ncbi:hypothetical protein [Streptomyces sp. DSM 40750]|uniref:hypothetical protein n=1 Tax=Streptomyces sp. DSM 40750 TaxID=2801030 RepID=UPI00214BAA13|nr:hypothetical protein [Streptomyces sp. DSM 40750]UUU19447.1 hypothetical protein JIX55_03515 [Streptomyces sp. DSM 40750]UUU27209.1 hypothetical protein JIX55_47240 [Streptomyces sp. DSM 40750]
MILPSTLTQYRTLIIEGHEGPGRTHLMTELAHLGFEVRHMPPFLHHLDPALPYRELLAGPGRPAVDGNLVAELVYGPLRRGRSRVTWIQALDLAETVAERDGAMLHLTATSGHAHSAEAVEAATAYARAFRTLAQHVPVVTLDAGEPSRPIRAPASRPSQLWRNTEQLTIG